MPNRWLIFASIGTITIIVFVLFIVRLMPVKIPKHEPGIVPGSIDQPTVTFVNPSRGPGAAPVTIVEFSDFECDACKELAPSIEAVMRTHADRVRHVWKHMPNESAHPLAIPAAVAAQCAFQQNKFWEFHDALLERQSYLSESQFSQIASELDLNVDAFSSCYATQDPLPTIMRDYNEGVGLGIVATPTIYVNGIPYVGAMSAEKLTSYVEQALTNK